MIIFDPSNPDKAASPNSGPLISSTNANRGSGLVKVRPDSIAVEENNE